MLDLLDGGVSRGCDHGALVGGSGGGGLWSLALPPLDDDCCLFSNVASARLALAGAPTAVEANVSPPNV